MKAKRPAPVRGGDEPRRTSRNTTRRPADAPPRKRKPAREQRPQHSAPATNPFPRPTDGPARPKNASQAKARAKARKAKAPKVVRPPLRERIIVKLASIELNPRALVAQGAVCGARHRIARGRPRRHALAVDGCRGALLRVGTRTRDQSGALAAEGSAGTSGARGSGRACAGRGGPQPWHDPVQGHRAPGAGRVGQLGCDRHTQTRPGRRRRRR